MDPKIEVLELFLNALGESSSISSIDDRLRLQKAVYIGQLFGVDLGYRYSWYAKGPYSPLLTQDYYRLAETRTGAVCAQGLKQEVIEKLERAKTLLSVPQGVDLRPHHWYELLASLHYLYKVSKLDRESVIATMKRTKSHLEQWIESGESSLRAYALLN